MMLHIWNYVDIQKDLMSKILLVISLLLLLVSSKSYNPLQFIVLPIQCYNNIYLDKILDSLKIEESSDGKNLLNINYKHGKEVSRDEGDYQINNKNLLLFSNLYNEGKMINPYNRETARRIARQLLIDNYNYSGNWCSALIMYNCGTGQWLKNPPIKSLRFAERILRRIK